MKIPKLLVYTNGCIVVCIMLVATLVGLIYGPHKSGLIWLVGSPFFLLGSFFFLFGDVDESKGRR